jgi:hypothetical protein
MNANPLPDADILRELLSYDPETGLFTWLQNRGNTALAGTPAGALNNSGYILICVNMKRYQAHRIAYKMMYGVDPPALLDHIDGDTKNNRISNLRPATPNKNQGNTKTPVHNRSGIKGVSWNKKMKRWVAQIGVNNKRVYLGGFHTKEEAACAYADAARKHFGDFAKGEGL